MMLYRPDRILTRRRKTRIGMVSQKATAGSGRPELGQEDWNRDRMTRTGKVSQKTRTGSGRPEEQGQEDLNRARKTRTE